MKARSRIFHLLLLSIVTLLVPSELDAADWPQWRGRQRDGKSGETMDVSVWPPTVRWTRTIESGESSVVISEGRLYTMGRQIANNVVYCIDANTGTNVWTKYYAAGSGFNGYGPQATPTVYSNEVYTFDDSGMLYCFNKTNGATLWSKSVALSKPAYGYSSSPLIEGNMVILNASGVGAAVNRTSRNVAWPTGTVPTGAGYASAVRMVVDGVAMVLVQTVDALKAVNPTNGVVFWSYPYDSASMSGYAAADPVVYDGNKILLYENGLVLLRAGTNAVTEVWPLNVDSVGAGFSTPVILGSYAYGINIDGDVCRISLVDGTVDWNLRVSGSAAGALIAADCNLIVLADGQLRVLTIGMDGFEEGGRTPVTVCSPNASYGWTPPAFSDGKIYCRVNDRLTCYQLGGGLVPGPRMSLSTNAVQIVCVEGQTGSVTVVISNPGDTALKWNPRINYRTAGADLVRVVHEYNFITGSVVSGWCYDNGNDLLVSYSTWTNSAKYWTKIRPSDGVFPSRTNTAPDVLNPSSVAVTSNELWVSDANKGFKILDSVNLGLLRTVPHPAGWQSAKGLSFGDGSLFATTGTGAKTNVYRIDKITGSISGSVQLQGSISYGPAYLDRGLWGTATYGVSEPYHLLQFDAETGVKIRDVEFPYSKWPWEPGEVSGLMGVYHPCVGAGRANMWMVKTWGKSLFELDLSWLLAVEATPRCGTVPAGGSGTLTLTVDGLTLPKGRYSLSLTLVSNDPGATNVVMPVSIVVVGSGPNHAPWVEAGTNLTVNGIDGNGWEEVDLNAIGEDPDFDDLVFTWWENGQRIGQYSNAVLELDVGAHNLTVVVDDLRGGTATDTVCVTVTDVWNGDWPQECGPDNSLWVYENDGFPQNWPPIERWQFSVGKNTHYNAVASEGRVYAQGNQSDGRIVFCLDGATGNVIWRKAHPRCGREISNTYGYNQPKSDPVIDGDRLYTMEDQGDVCCWNKYTGSSIWHRVLWEVPVPSHGFNDTPVVAGDRLVTSRCALNKYTGGMVWQYPGGNQDGAFRKLVWNSRRYIVQNQLWLVNAMTGVPEVPLLKQSENLDYNGGMGRATRYGRDKLFWTYSVRSIGSQTDDWYNPNVSGGEWQFIAVKGDYAYPGGQCVDMRDGSLKWSIGGWDVIGVDDKLVTLSGGLRVGKVSASKWDEQGRSAVTFNVGAGFRTGLMYSDKRIYVNGSVLTCFDTGFSAPVVENRQSGWDGERRRGVMRGFLENTGGRTPVTGSIYWGLTDGGTNAAAWAHCDAVGTVAVGLVERCVEGLTSNRVYYYRCYASNDRGGTWAGSTRTMSTYATSTVEGEESLILHWPLDEGAGTIATDVSGNGNHGTISAPVWTNGIIGGALNGGSCVSSTLSTPLKEEWSVATWLHTGNGGSTRGFVELREYPFSPNCLQMNLDKGSKWTVEESGSTKEVWGVTVNKWCHFGMTRKGNVYTLYLDGVPKQQWTRSGRTYRCIRRNEWALSDDVRVYGRALEPWEMALLARMPGTSTGAIATQPSGGSDDAEEVLDGSVSLSDVSLELGSNGVGQAQTVGLRFPNVGISRGGTVLGANIQFCAGDFNTPAQTGKTQLEIWGEANDNAVTFGGAAHNLSARPKTRVGIPWNVLGWSKGEQGAAQQTPNLAGIVQEVVDRSGWTNGNALAFLIKGDGRHGAYASEYTGGKGPKLKVVWTDAKDLDGDGIPDCWERAVLREAPSSVAPGGDNDGDGILNVQEYVMGTDASDADSSLKLGIRMGPDGRLIVSFEGKGTYGIGYNGEKRYYYLDTLTNLLTNTWQCVRTMTNTTDQTIETECTNSPAGRGEGFYRLRTTLGVALPPVANAGPDQVVTNTSVTLDGSGSCGLNGNPLTYSWRTNGVQIATGVRPVVTLPFGAHTVTLTVSDTGQTSTDTVTIQVVAGYLTVTVNGIPRSCPLLSHAEQDTQTGSTVVQNGGTTLRMTGNNWKMIDLGAYSVATNTVLEFDFSSSAQGEIHGVAFDTDANITPVNAGFELWGTQVWENQTYNNYGGTTPAVKHYTIPVGTYFTGPTRYLVFANDHDVTNPTAVSVFSNVTLR